MDTLLEIVTYPLFGIALWEYAAALAAIFFSFIFRRISRAVIRKLKVLAERTVTDWDDALIEAVAKPLDYAWIFGGVAVALLILPIPEAPTDVDLAVKIFLKGSSVAFVVWIGMRLVDNLSQIFEAKAEKTESRLDDQLIPIIRKSSKFFVFTIGFVVVLQNLGYSVGSLVAGLGIGGAALALASKDTVANLFGSIVVFVDRPFQVGDWVEIGQYEGTVEEVGLRVTRIRTFANSLITMPNAHLTTMAINNWSSMKKRRISISVGLTYDSTPEQMEQAVEAIREVIRSNDDLYHDFFLVNFNQLGAHALEIFIYTFTKTTVWGEYLNVRQQLLLDIMKAVDKLGLGFAFPTQTIHLAQGSEIPRDLQVLPDMGTVDLSPKKK